MKTFAFAAAIATLMASQVFAQEKKEEKKEEPFWAIGRPKAEAADRMAPVPAHPIPTAADKLPLKKMRLPPGFKAEV